MDTVNLVLPAYNFTVPVNRDGIMTYFPNTVLSSVLELDPSTTTIELATPEITPDIASVIASFAEGKFPNTVTSTIDQLELAARYIGSQLLVLANITDVAPGRSFRDIGSDWDLFRAVWLRGGNSIPSDQLDLIIPSVDQSMLTGYYPSAISLAVLLQNTYLLALILANTPPRTWDPQELQKIILANWVSGAKLMIDQRQLNPREVPPVPAKGGYDRVGPLTSVEDFHSHIVTSALEFGDYYPIFYETMLISPEMFDLLVLWANEDELRIFYHVADNMASITPIAGDVLRHLLKRHDLILPDLANRDETDLLEVKELDLVLSRPEITPARIEDDMMTYISVLEYELSSSPHNLGLEQVLRFPTTLANHPKATNQMRHWYNLLVAIFNGDLPLAQESLVSASWPDPELLEAYRKLAHLYGRSEIEAILT